MRFFLLIACTLLSSKLIFAQSEKSKPKKTKPSETYTYVEQMPEYPGGMEAMQDYLTKNLRYPEKAKIDNIKGHVVLKFIVQEDGSLNNIELIKGLSEELNAEAIRSKTCRPGNQEERMERLYRSITRFLSCSDSIDLTKKSVPGGTLLYFKPGVYVSDLLSRK
jgi:hypothetical protein